MKKRMMKKCAVVAVILMTILVTMTGCGYENKIVGLWQTVWSNKIVDTEVFKSKSFDESLKEESSDSFKKFEKNRNYALYDSKDAKDAILKGKWKIDKDTLSVTIDETDYEWTIIDINDKYLKYYYKSPDGDIYGEVMKKVN